MSRDGGQSKRVARRWGRHSELSKWRQEISATDRRLPQNILPLGARNVKAMAFSVGKCPIANRLVQQPLAGELGTISRILKQRFWIGDDTCPFDRSSGSLNRSRLSKERACICAAPLVSETPKNSTHSCLLDDFRNDVPEDYLAGFPWHPHRGIETVTYVLAGTVEHGDSMGNHGAIAAGDVQWMTAGSGIIHQEMPKGDQSGRMHGFQLWANLPSSLKMTAPRYQEVKAIDIPEVTDDDGTHVRIVCGSFWGKTGPVKGIAADPNYLDVSVAPGQAEDSAGGDHSPRLRLRFRRDRKVLQCLRSTRGAD